ncbi:MAG: DNA primase [Phycisphaeraceae bacterium]|nr:DNA primase [Phycisphaeraceae bacterium]
MGIAEDPKRLVQQATDIVALVGEQVALRAKGREFMGLCPFHEDHNPSLYVSPAKQIYKCFVCGAGGDVFSFVMNYHKMPFPEALRYLAERAGVKLPTSTFSPHADSSSRDEREELAKANDQALKFFRAMLRDASVGTPARDYLTRRAVSADMAEAFELGFAPDEWDRLAIAARNRGWSTQALEKAGLLSNRRTGEGMIDRFRYRLIFPILDALGRPIAFGARRLREEDEPKYLNSPETLLFRKSSTLYGLHRAKKPIIDSQVAVVVEGYTDVIACHQAGISNVVATLGTALTAEHARELRRYAAKVVLIFDADEAGQKAADRALEIFLTEDLDVAVAVLPEGPGGAKMDPAELLGLPDGREIWNHSVQEAADALTHQFSRFQQDFEAATTLTGRQKLAESYLQNLARLGLGRQSPIRRAMIVQRIANLLKIDEATISTLLAKTPARPAPIRHAGAQESPTTSTPDNSALNNIDLGVDERTIRSFAAAERQLIGCLIRQPSLFHMTLSDGRFLDETITPAELISSSARRLYQRIHELMQQGQELTLTGLLGDLAHDGQTDLAALATEMEREVEQKMEGSGVTLESLMNDLAKTLLVFHQNREYQKRRGDLVSALTGQGQPVDPTLSNNEILEHNRNTASPLRYPGLKRPRPRK